MVAGLGNALLWVSLVGSLAPALLVARPVNKWLIGGGRGHAVAPGPHWSDRADGESAGDVGPGCYRPGSGPTRRRAGRRYNR